jgi:DNA-binding phage protein
MNAIRQTANLISDFDAAEYLRDEESIAAFLNASAQSGDPAVLLHALSTVARARSMTELAYNEDQSSSPATQHVSLLNKGSGSESADGAGGN